MLPAQYFRTRLFERAAAAVGRRRDTAAATETWSTQRRVYPDLRRQKRNAFWQSTVDADRSNPRRLWQSINTLLGRGRPPTDDGISAESFHQFFEDKVASVRASTESAPMPQFFPGPSGVSWREFDPVDRHGVVESICHLPSKSCAADSVPTSVFRQLADDVSPFLSVVFNKSMTEGVVPAAFKMRSRCLKKLGMHATDVQSFRPISNLSVISNLLERLVAYCLLSAVC